MITDRRDSGFPLDAGFTNVEENTAIEILDQIATNPEISFNRETVILELENPHLNDFLFARIQATEEAHVNSYLEGSIWMYKLLEAQAVKRGKELPKLSSLVVSTFLDDLIANAHKGEDMGQVMRRNAIQMEKMEPGIKFFVDEICKYRVDPSAIRGAMAEVYFILLKGAKTSSLNKIFGD